MSKTTKKLSRPRTSKPTLRLLSSKTIYSGPVFSVTTDRIREPNGVTATRDMIRHSGSIVIMAVDDSGVNAEPKVLLVKQYRYAAKAAIWELPAGRIDPGEDKLAAAKRELREETGFRARSWKRALRFYVSPGFLDETMDVYMATDLTAGESAPEEDEKITPCFFPLHQAVKMALSGKILDAKTIASVMWLELKRMSANQARPN